MKYIRGDIHLGQMQKKMARKFEQMFGHNTSKYARKLRANTSKGQANASKRSKTVIKCQKIQTEADLRTKL